LEHKENLFPGATLTACSPPDGGDLTAFGFADGSVRVGRLGFKTQFLKKEDATDALLKLQAGEFALYETGLVQRMPDGSFRGQKLAVDLYPPVPFKNASPVALLDYSKVGTNAYLSVLTADGKLRTGGVTTREGSGQDQLLFEWAPGDLALPDGATKEPPVFL